MQFKMISALAVAALGATNVAATYHGEFAEHNGLAIRYHQLARGIFTGVPAEQWDDAVHKRSEAEWDVEELTWGHHHHNGTHHGQRDLALESRNLKGNCQAVVGCVKSLGGAAILTGYNTWVTLAEYAAGGTVGKDLMTFLNQPFVANAAGVAIAGTISGQINAATSTECSTSSSEADVITAAIAAAVAAKPDATEVAVTINGPSGSWTITVAAGGENTAPAATC